MANTYFDNVTEDISMSSDPSKATQMESMDILKRLYVVVIIALSGVLLINIIFQRAVFVCKRVKRKRSLRYIYETNPKRS